MASSPTALYADRARRFDREAAERARAVRLHQQLRLVVFAVTAIGAWFLISQGRSQAAWLFMAGAAAAFVILVARHPAGVGAEPNSRPTSTVRGSRASSAGGPVCLGCPVRPRSGTTITRTTSTCTVTRRSFTSRAFAEPHPDRRRCSPGFLRPRTWRQSLCGRRRCARWPAPSTCGIVWRPRLG